jgi:predicted amidohydrolase
VKVAIAQINSSDQPEQNLKDLLPAIRAAGERGVDLFCTPEVTNCVSMSRDHQSAVLSIESDDSFLRAVQDAAREAGIAVALGSLALKREGEARFANRSFLISSDGEVIARYDKIHMFDVQISDGEGYRESEGYQGGAKAVLTKIGDARLGLSICYDLRFAALYRRLAQAGADILMVPSAFTVPTGKAHWEPLLRARAIETGCFVIAAAQVGRHEGRDGRSRETYGHSLVINPWGEVILDAGSEIGVYDVDLDLREVAQARQRIPSLHNDRDFSGP